MASGAESQSAVGDSLKGGRTKREERDAHVTEAGSEARQTGSGGGGGHWFGSKTIVVRFFF